MNWKRLQHYEFWPFWFFYIPAYFYYFILALKSKHWVYFSVLNQCMNFGGALLSSKYNYLKYIPQQWKPKTIKIQTNHSFNLIKQKLSEEQIHFPLIIKPDMGERGKNVEKINNEQQLKKYIENSNRTTAYLLQEFINYPIELGILFYWDIHHNPQISSIGKKQFCVVVGNGKDTMQQLICENHRIIHRKSILKKQFKDQWEEIIPKGKSILLEPIGSHNRGTAFLDARNHFSKEMLNWIVSCTKNLEGFDYGRIDLKIKNWDAFQTQKGIKILEINGVNSEPIHIYDPTYSIWSAYKDIFKHMHIIYSLSKERLKDHHKTQTLYEFIKASRLVLNNNKPQNTFYL